MNNWIDALTEQAQRRGQKLAFAYIDENGQMLAQLSFEQLLQQARELAAHIQSHCQCGERVLLLYPSGLEYIRAFYACMLAGVVAVPLYSPNNDRKLELIQAIADDCSPALALTTAKYADKARAKATGKSLQDLTWLSTDLLEGAADRSWQRPDLHPDDLAYLQYTSGSTSSPKGVVLTHGITLHHCQELQALWDTDANSVLVSWLPHFHDLGQVFAVLQPVFQGMSSILMAPATFMQTPGAWLKAISDHGATHSAAPDFAYKHCADHVAQEDIQGLDLRRWRVAVNGAEPVRADSILAFHERFGACGATLQMHRPSYGLAEATLVVTAHRSEVGPRIVWFDGEQLRRNVIQACSEKSPKAVALVSNGQPASGVAVAVVDPVSHHGLNENQLGEIWVSGNSVGLGYWGRPVESQSSFAAVMQGGADGRKYLRTGDLGFFHEGELFIAGRSKDVIVVRGSNHYPQDIELTVESSHPLVRHGYTAAFSVTTNGQEQLVIAAERKRYFPDEVDYDAALRQIQAAVVSQHGINASEILLLKPGSISKTTSGKIQRKKCREEWECGVLNVVASHKQMQAAREPGQQGASATPPAGRASPAPSTIKQVMRLSVRSWITDWLCREQRLEPSNVRPMESLATHGVCSADMFRLHCDLEDFLQCEVSSELLWESGSIDVLTDVITDHCLLAGQRQTQAA